MTVTRAMVLVALGLVSACSRRSGAGSDEWTTPGGGSASGSESEAPPATPLDDVRRFDERSRALGSDQAREPLVNAAVARWSRWSQSYLAAGRRQEADALFEAIAAVAETHRNLGYQARPRGIHRETFSEGRYAIEGWAYFEPVRVDPDSDRTFRWVTFHVKEGPREVGRIDLQPTEAVQPSYALWSTQGESHHRQHEYGQTRPDYWTVRSDALAALSHGLTTEAPTASANSRR